MSARPGADAVTPAEVFAIIRRVAALADVPQAEAAASITAVALARPAADLASITTEAVERLRTTR